jgi:hypothetical protein
VKKRNAPPKVGIVVTAKYETRVKELLENLPDLILLVEPLLADENWVRFANFDYDFLFCCRFFSLTPGPPPFSPMNSLCGP